LGFIRKAGKEEATKGESRGAIQISATEPDHRNRFAIGCL